MAERTPRRWIAVAVTAALIGVVACLWRLPQGTFEDAAVLSLKTALGVYRQREGRHPDSLVGVSGVLQEVTGTSNEIISEGRDAYTVAIDGREAGSVIRLRYRVGEDGVLEEFHVQSVTRTGGRGP